MDPDGKKTGFDYGPYPELGQQKASIADPAGLALRSETDYETAGSGGYLRPTRKRLPAQAGMTGAGVAFDYYAQSGSSNVADNPCPAGGTGLNQGGALKKKTSVTAGDGTTQTETYIYFQDGLLAASQRNTEGTWTCYTYDARGRILTKAVPAFGGQPARTVTYNYAVGGDPTITTVADNSTSSVVSNPTIRTTTDWLGRTLTYTDALGRVTATAYDDPSGRVQSTAGPSGYGQLTQAYDSAKRPTTTMIGGSPIATVVYDAASGVSTGVTYPAGSGNGASLATTNDIRGRLSQMSWTGPGSVALASDTVARTVGGRVNDEAIDGTIGGTGIPTLAASTTPMTVPVVSPTPTAPATTTPTTTQRRAAPTVRRPRRSSVLSWPRRTPTGPR